MTAHPNWATGAYQQLKIGVPDNPTQWDLRVKELRLTNQPEKWVNSPALRRWAEYNRKHRYVPDDLLKAWGMEVEDCW